MAIRDKVTVRMKAGGKPYVAEVKRPGGLVDYLWKGEGFVTVQETTRKGRIIRSATFNTEDVRSVEFEPGT